MTDQQPFQDSADPYAVLPVFSETTGFRALRGVLDVERGIPWHRCSDATTTVFADEDGVAIQIQRPPFRCVLSAGEFYSVPPSVDLLIESVTGAPVKLTVFQYGTSFDATRASPPTLAHVGTRTSLRHEIDIGSETDLGNLQFGLTRLDVLVSRPDVRLLVQGHGQGQCIPWHSHDVIADTFFCTQGQARVATRNPDVVHVLSPGQSCTVEPTVAHMVSGVNSSPCEILILQGIGRYNYVAGDVEIKPD